MKKFTLIFTLLAICLTCFSVLSMYHSSKAFADEEREIINKQVISCNFEEKLIRIYPEKVIFFLKGANGFPNGIMAEDTEGVTHTILFVKGSPYKCAITEEKEI